MPDEAEVEQALAAFVSGVLYPDGSGARSAIDVTCRVYRGMPVAETLEADLLRNVAHVAVQALPGGGRVTTRYPAEWVGAVPACPLEAEAEGVSVRFSGTAGTGMAAGVLVDGRAYAWRVEAGATPGVVAAVLADMVRADRPATLSGTAITFPGAHGVAARAVADGQGGTELRRQEVVFRVSTWSPSVLVRDTLASFVDLQMARVQFLDVGGWGCRVLPGGTRSSDEGAAVRAWRRELRYRIEYPTVLAEALPTMLFGSGTVNGAEYVG